MRPAALIAARPQPDMVGQQECDAAFAEPRQQQQRLARGARPDPRGAPVVGVARAGLVMTGVVTALRVSTVRKNRLQCGGSVFEPSSPRVTGWRLPASER